MARPTIRDIAEAAGVSKPAVSYALNGKPGVSPETRARILTIADELGWVPSSAARALSSSRADAVGLIAVRSPELVATEPFFMRMVAGIERTLAARGVALLLTILPDTTGELELYRSWWASRKVDGMLLIDLRRDDPRPAWVRSTGAPAVIIGAQRQYRGIASTRPDPEGMMRRALALLHAKGHRRIGRVRGPGRLEHIARRSTAFAELTRELLGEEQPQADADFTAESGVAATRELLASERPPTAIVYDNDVMAVASVAELTGSGVAVPGDVAVLAWDDSSLCQLVRPTVTAFTHDVVEEGSAAAELLLARIGGGPVEDRWLSPAHLTERESTA
ncbi:LacI family DNA-binding transcriptional regulator [Pseudonocardia sp. TRM90224]|uniref:LacI family DNA-binding transcriptional regulator n=1 Tax=Pseudonocardia sp. TRM90224 TaxID=2812678 RepID=UPI001E5B0887|nr:LacI family DNA-binding transcriptional regulator [Pseudonocardia sp. TRM90224]